VNINHCYPLSQLCGLSRGSLWFYKHFCRQKAADCGYLAEGRGRLRSIQFLCGLRGIFPVTCKTVYRPTFFLLRFLVKSACDPPRNHGSSLNEVMGLQLHAILRVRWLMRHAAVVTTPRKWQITATSSISTKMEDERREKRFNNQSDTKKATDGGHSDNDNER